MCINKKPTLQKDQLTSQNAFLLKFGNMNENIRREKKTICCLLYLKRVDLLKGNEQ